MEFGMPTLIENRTLDENIALCKQLGLSFVELNMNFPEYQIDKIEDVDWFCKRADEAGIYYTIHLDENLNIADFNPFILGNKDKLSHFHIHDGRENPPKDHLALGDGEIDLLERLNMAKECHARCVLETKTIEALKKSVEWLKNEK